MLGSPPGVRRKDLTICPWGGKGGISEMKKSIRRILLLMICFFILPSCSSRNPFKDVKIYDGSLVRVEDNDTAIRVRLAGQDTPKYPGGLTLIRAVDIEAYGIGDLEPSLKAEKEARSAKRGMGIMSGKAAFAVILYAISRHRQGGNM